VPDDNAMPQDLFHQLRLAVLDRPDDDGLRTITTSRSDLDIGEAFLRDRQQLLDHLTVTHNDGSPVPGGRSGQPQPMALGTTRQRLGDLPARPPCPGVTTT